MTKPIGHQEETNMFLRNIFEAIQRTGQGKTAVIGWGRGMGHKGHMMLASSVITQASKAGGDPYFVVSKTVGKDDPITPDEKIAIYKKVFPQSGHIFQPATDEIPDLTRVLQNLNQQGYTSVTVVLGADQVKAFQYLKNYNNKPDKSGNILYSFDNLDVISRQETGDPSAGEEGPRATPMRQVLMDPTKSEQEQFAVWRDAMSPEIGDDEVRDLMMKAKERMTAMNAPKPKKAKAVGEEAAGVGVIASKKQAKDPRYSMSLTKDVRPGQVTKNLKAFSLVEESSNTAMAHTAKRLTDPKDGAVAKLRAAGDKKRDSHYMSTQIAKNDRTSKDEWGNLKELSSEKLGQYKKAAGAQASAADKAGNTKKADKRFSGIVKATKKQFANDEKDVGEASLATMRDYFAGDNDARDSTKLSQMRKFFNKHKPEGKVTDKKFNSASSYQAWLKKQGNQSVEEKMLPKSAFAGSNKNKLGSAGQLKGSMKRPAQAGDLVGSAEESIEVEGKKKGADGKACWDGYRYNGTKNGKDSCVKVSEEVENIMDALINKIIVNEAISHNRK